MEHSKNTFAGASTDERASPSTPPAAGATPPAAGPFAAAADSEAYWAGARDALRSAADPATPEASSAGGEAADGPPGRRLRVDGWVGWKKARFLEALASGAVVADACRAAGMSVASAYALRNRRSGRAFARMWDAILIHRARSRLADDNLSRAMNGCAERIVRDGAVVAERHRFDNRLSMAMLTRLDRLAERDTGDEAILLRALSDDFEEYLDLVEAEGDEDAFVEARRPKPAKDEQPGLDFEPDQLDELAALSGCPDWRDVHFSEVPVDGLDPNCKSKWSHEDWVRAGRSLYLVWLDMMAEGGQPLPPGPDCPAAYDRIRRSIVDRIRAQAPADGDEGVRASAPDPESNDEASQASTSSTSRPNRHERRRRRKLAKRACRR
jgi:hypothetical protein